MIRGLIIPIITPLLMNRELDRESLGKLLSTVTEQSSALLLNSIYPGEGTLLPAETESGLIRETMKITGGRTALLISITGNTAAETLNNVKRIEHLKDDLNYNGEIVLFDCPLRYHSNRKLPAHYEKLTGLSSFPLILSNNPGLISSMKMPLKRYNIRTAVLKNILENDRIAGLEYSGNLHRLLNYMKAARYRNDFIFYDGNELNFLNNPGTGGVISIGANILPEYWKKVVDSSLYPDDSQNEDHGSRKHLWQIRQKVQELHACYIKNPAALVKTALKYKGIIASDAAAGDTPEPTEEEKKKIYGVLDSMEFAK